MDQRKLRSSGYLIVAAALLCIFPAASVLAQNDAAPLRPKEVSDEAERSIARGLQFLARNQQPDGSFGKARFESDVYPTAMSSLVGLAFLSSGSTPTRGPYAKNLQKITDYLLKYSTRNATGLIANQRADEERTMYCHAFGMTYLAQVLGHETDAQRREKIQSVLRAAVKMTRDVQTDDGGWGYVPSHWNDEGTLTVTQLQGLRACRDAGIAVPLDVINRGVRYIEDSTNPEGSVRYRVRSNTYNIRPGVTCAAVVALWNAGRYDDPNLRRISSYVQRNIRPQWGYGHHAEYVMYYLAQAKFVLGGKEWVDFYREASRMLVGAQASDGSWDGADGGEVYGTAIALLVLQLPYSRLPVYQR
jgi:hypothetical protein